MRTIVLNAQVEIILPDVIEPTSISQEMYSRRPEVKIGLSMKLDDVVLRELGGRTITIKQLLLTGIYGKMLPVMDENGLVTYFTVEEADKPITVGVR